MSRIEGLASVLGHVDFDRWVEAESVSYGSLVVTRWFPWWWGISPFSSPFVRVELQR